MPTRPPRSRRRSTGFAVRCGRRSQPTATVKLSARDTARRPHTPVRAGDAAVFFIHADHLETPRAIVNVADIAVWTWDSAPFGDTSPNENPEGLGAFAYNLRFPGQYFDQETHTHYNYFRNYEPGTAAYLQTDPIGLRGGIATYSYVGADPLTRADPTGEAWPKRPKPCDRASISLVASTRLDFLMSDGGCHGPCACVRGQTEA